MSEKSKSNQSTTGDSGNIREKRKNEILGILLTALGLFSGIAIFTSSAGLVGQMLVDFYTRIIGSGCYLIPVLLSIWGIALIRLKTVKFNTRIIGFLLSYITIFAIFHTYLYNNYPLESALQGIGGGYLGGGLAWVLLKLFGTLGTYIVLMSFLLIGNLLWFDVLLHSSLGKIINLFKKLMQKLNQKKLVVEEYIPEGVVSIEDGGNEGGNGDKDLLADDYYFENEEEYNEGQNNREIYNNHKEFTDENVEEDEGNYREGNGNSKGNNQENNQINEDNINYELPDITLLKRSGRKKVKLENKSNLLEETLKSFGVEATVIDVSHGPSITRYEVQPASGVKVSKIVNLADDIALSLAASDVRIEAPIPGKAAVGIEVPHQGNIFVRIRDVLSSKEFKNAKGKLTLALGKGIDGRPIVADLSSMPHLLVAGATGSGKSVCINTFITSILYKATPDEVKFILVDPKKVELSNYKGLPHLFTPVVVDPKKASSVLKLVVKEMEERYELFSESGTRGINSYNKKVSEEEQLPYIVVIIDELSDLMMVAASEVEDSICRLAQMSRAAGIHLVIATQRPSVDVITGLIKANIPSRISFAVSSQTDSRTILDMGGAEKLLGKGDMLYAPVGEQKPIRIQGAFISNEEINNLVYYTKKQTDAEFEVELDEINDVQISTDNDKDELYEEAVKLVVKYRASISMLQRRLHIGHSRAARMIDTMEEEGIVGPYVGSKPREVLISEEELESYLKEDEFAETAATSEEKDNDNENRNEEE